MFLPLIVQETPRREIAVAERLLFRSPAGSFVAFVANDGRIRLPNGERVPAVRRTLAELRRALPRFVEIRRVPAPSSGFPILSSGTILRVTDDTTLLEALRGLPQVERVTVFAADDSVTAVDRPEFGRQRLVAGDALVLGREVIVPRASIVGGVARPGVYDLQPETTMGALILLAGGTTPRALTDRIEIERDRKRIGPLNLLGDKDTPVRTGDVVRVPVTDRVAYVSIAGAVKRPGLHEILPGMTVAQAITAAGGLTLPADGLLVVLRSVTNPKRKTVKAKATELAKFPTVEGGDILEIAPPLPRSQ